MNPTKKTNYRLCARLEPPRTVGLASKLRLHSRYFQDLFPDSCQPHHRNTTTEAAKTHWMFQRDVFALTTPRSASISAMLTRRARHLSVFYSLIFFPLFHSFVKRKWQFHVEKTMSSESRMKRSRKEKQQWNQMKIKLNRNARQDTHIPYLVPYLVKWQFNQCHSCNNINCWCLSWQWVRQSNVLSYFVNKLSLMVLLNRKINWNSLGFFPFRLFPKLIL